MLTGSALGSCGRHWRSSLTKPLILIDGDQYLHRGCVAVERDTRWDDENHVLVANETEAWEVVLGSIGKVLEHFDSNHHILCFTEGLVFRKQIDPSYKTSRKDSRKPLCYFAIRHRLKSAFNCHWEPGLEADDVMGILATKPDFLGNTVIVSQDKDMKTIPGTLWDGAKLTVISEEEADYWHMFQTLTGDASDGYKGCPGIGPVRAEKFLNDCAHYGFHMWANVVGAFHGAGLTEEDALTQARLARILRWSDFDHKLRVPILWTPNGAYA